MSHDQIISLTGRTLGHYSLGSLLNTGDSTEIYRARDLKLRREVAVKVLLPTLQTDPSSVARFRSEVRRQAALRHPNIVPVYEFGEQEGLLYLIMPLEPESLRDRMFRRGSLRIADALAVAIQVASALEATHALGIVHRDVKPENILLDRDGRALLSGFFLARELAFLRRQGAVQTLADTGLPVGTPEYMAPEQLRGGPIDQRVDVYALGAVLYELLTGVVPHEATTPYEMAALALTEPIMPPSQRNAKVWPDLESVLLTSLSPDPELRYFDVAPFAAALRETSKRSIGEMLQASLPVFRKRPPVNPYGQSTPHGSADYDERRHQSTPGAAVLRSERTPETPELMRIFVSHSHADDTFTRRLVADLRSAGADVWVDQSDVTYDDFIKRINDGLKERQWLVLVMTPSSLKSQWVEREVNAALQMVVSKRMRGVIPVVAAPCREDAIPPMWATLHRYDATIDYNRALRGLLHALGLSNV